MMTDKRGCLEFQGIMDKTDTGSNGYKSFRPNMRISIWLTTAVVIAFILILALTVNYAREKGIVEQFSRQQMAIAQGNSHRDRRFHFQR